MGGWIVVEAEWRRRGGVEAGARDDAEAVVAVRSERFGEASDHMCTLDANWVAAPMQSATSLREVLASEERACRA